MEQVRNLMAVRQFHFRVCHGVLRNWVCLVHAYLFCALVSEFVVSSSDWAIPQWT